MLSPTQARRKYIFDSMGLFLDRNVKAGYDTEAALTHGTSYDISTPLTILEGQPDDDSIIRKAPSIAVSTITGAGGGFTSLGMNAHLRSTNFVFYCYPAITADGEPNSDAQKLLMSYLDDAFQGAYGIKIVDYSNPACNAQNIIYCADVMVVYKVGDPTPRSIASTLAQEKNRFDLHVSVRYEVNESLKS